MSDYDWDKHTWLLIKKLISAPRYLVRHQIESFNIFLDKYLPDIIQSFNPIVLNYDYVTDQLYFKLSDEFIRDNDEEYVSKFNKFKQWKEYKSVDILHLEILNILNDIENNKSNTMKNFDLKYHMNQTNKKNNTNIIKKSQDFIKKNFISKKYTLNKHRYELSINIHFSSYHIPTIHENNGTQKILYPNEARLRNCSYSSNLYVNVDYIAKEFIGENFNKIKVYKKRTLENINLGEIPIMIGSSACNLHNIDLNRSIDYEECMYDQGGYFIINGSEKVVVSQERMAENKIYVFNKSNKQTKYSHISEIKSVKNDEIINFKNIQVKLLKKSQYHKQCLKLMIPHIKIDVPLFVVFKLLNVVEDKKILDYILVDVPNNKRREYKQVLIGTFKDSMHIKTQAEAFAYLTKYVSMMGYNRDAPENVRRTTYLTDVIVNDLLPHVGNDITKKAYFLGLMTKKLLDVYLKKKKI